MRALLGLFLATFGKTVEGLFLGWLANRQLSDANQALGASQASNATLKDIGEIADAQAQNNAMDRGGAGDVAERLRRELAADAPGDGAADPGGPAQG